MDESKEWGDEIGKPDFQEPTLFNMAEASEAGKDEFEIIEKPKMAPDLAVRPQGPIIFKSEFKKPIPDAVRYERLRPLLYERWSEWGIKDDRWRYYAMAAYLFGARVRETLQLRRADFSTVRVQGLPALQVELITEKKKSRVVWKAGKAPDAEFVRNENGTYKQLPPDESLYDVVAAPMVRRSITLLIEPPAGRLIVEAEMLKDFMGYLETKDDEQFLFNFTKVGERNMETERNTAWRTMQKINFGPLRVTYFDETRQQNTQRVLEDYWGYNHYFRHVRLTHLKRYYRFSDTMLQKWCGWSDPSMATRYTHLESEDIAAAQLVGLPLASNSVPNMV